MCEADATDVENKDERVVYQDREADRNWQAHDAGNMEQQHEGRYRLSHVWDFKMLLTEVRNRKSVLTSDRRLKRHH